MWAHPPGLSLGEASLLAPLQVDSSQPLAEACVTGPFPRHGWCCLLVLKSMSCFSLCVLLSLPLLAFLGPLSKNCLASNPSSGTLEGEAGQLPLFLQRESTRWEFGGGPSGGMPTVQVVL